MELIPWILIGSWLLLAFGCAHQHPNLLAPQCPFCAEPLEGDESEAQQVLKYRDWQIG